EFAEDDDWNRENQRYPESLAEHLFVARVVGLGNVMAVITSVGRRCVGGRRLVSTFGLITCRMFAHDGVLFSCSAGVFDDMCYAFVKLIDVVTVKEQSPGS